MVPDFDIDRVARIGEFWAKSRTRRFADVPDSTWRRIGGGKGGGGRETSRVAMTDRTWQEYQEAAADFFRRLVDAEMDAQVEGVRGKHSIDVLITFDLYGVTLTWICECKLWRTRVKKEHVITLDGVLRDIGGDRGFMLSETGFQSGAVAMARDTNITLASLDDLQSLARTDLDRQRLRQMLEELVALGKRLRALEVVTRQGRTIKARLKEGAAGPSIPGALP